MKALVTFLRGVLLLLPVAYPSMAAEVEQGGEPDVTTFLFEGTASDWVMDDASGRVFASIYDGAKVIEIDPATGRQVREFAVGEKPRQVAVKAGKLVATVEAGVFMYIIDLKTNKVDGRVQLGGKQPYCLTHSQADNPWVFAISNTGDAWWDGEIFQVDVVERKVRKSQRVQGWRQSHALHMAMSPDGKWVVVDARGASSPSRADLMSVDEDSLTFTDVFGYHETFGQIAAGPGGRFWTLGQFLYSQDLRSRLRELKGNVLATHPSLDLVVGFGGGRFPGDPGAQTVLTFQTFSGQFLQEVKLMGFGGPAPAPGQRRPPRRVEAGGNRFVDDPVLQFDSKNNRLLVAQGSSAAVVELKSLGLKLEPLLLLALPTSQDVSLGQTLRLKLGLNDPKLMAGTSFSLEGAPAGMAIANGEVTWTPAGNDVGQHKVTVKAKRGASGDSAAVALNVTRPGVPLGGQVVQLVTDEPGGKALALVQLQADPRQMRRGVPPGQGGVGQELVLVDTAKLTVLSRRRIDEPLAAIAVTDKGLLVAPQNVARFQRLKVAGLSDEGRVFTNGPVFRFDTLPGGDVLVLMQGAVQRYDGQKLHAMPGLTQAAHMLAHDHFGNPAGLVRPVQGGVTLGPAVVDAKTGAPVFLTMAPNLPQMIADPRGGAQEARPGLWNRFVAGNQLMGPGNTMVATLGQHQVASIILSGHPLAVTAGFSAEGQGEGPRTRVLQLDFRNLIEGTRAEPLTVMETPIDPQRGYNEHAPIQLLERGGKLLVGADSRLFVLEVPADRVKGLPVPLHFVQRLEKLVFPVGQTVTLKTQAEGGTGKRTFELPGAPEGVSIDPTSGALSIDTATVWKAHLRQVSAGQVNIGGGNDGSDLVSAAQEQFKQLLGQDAGGAYPLAVHFRVTARDAENQRADLSGFVVLLAPAKEFTSAVAALRGGQPVRPGPMTQPVVAQPAGNTQELLHRIGELERRNRQLEAQLEVLKDMLVQERTGKGGSPGTRPAN